jgi:hypothetical protein
MTTYELWVHPQSGAVYALRLQEGRVTGCRGPLTPGEMSRGNLADYLYGELPEAIRRLVHSAEPDVQMADAWPEAGLPPRAGQAAGVIARALGRVAARRRARRHA